MVGDGSEGLPEHAPYDAIALAAASPRISDALVNQLAEGGRLVAPLNEGTVLAFARFVPVLTSAKGPAGPD